MTNIEHKSLVLTPLGFDGTILAATHHDLRRRVQLPFRGLWLHCWPAVPDLVIEDIRIGNYCHFLTAEGRVPFNAFAQGLPPQTAPGASRVWNVDLNVATVGQEIIIRVQSLSAATMRAQCVLWGLADGLSDASKLTPEDWEERGQKIDPKVRRFSCYYCDYSADNPNDAAEHVERAHADEEVRGSWTMKERIK